MLTCENTVPILTFWASAKGVIYNVHILTRADLDRQLVKSSFASVTVPELQLTIPPGRGQMTTVEGILRDTIRDLNIGQPVRRATDPVTAVKIEDMLTTLRNLIGVREGEEDDAGGVGMNDDEVRKVIARGVDDEDESIPFKPFTMSVDDPSGNSFFQFVGSQSDPQWNMRAYNRTLDQNVTLGLVARSDDMPEQHIAGGPVIADDHKMKGAEDFEERRLHNAATSTDDGTVVPEEVFSFPSTCSSCGYELETLMKQINIPYFQVSDSSKGRQLLNVMKNVIIMATNCYACGYRDNEIKSGGAISSKGKKITLKVEDEEDLSRDLLKVRLDPLERLRRRRLTKSTQSDTAGLEIPEIDLVLQPGTLGGRFTSLEGLLNEIYNELSTKVFRTGDSATSGIGQADQGVGKEERKFEDFLKSLKDCMSASKPFTLILDDPVSNSYLQNLYAPDPDPNMVIEEYERTFEQNEELGLNDMVLEGYNKEAESEVV